MSYNHLKSVGVLFLKVIIINEFIFSNLLAAVFLDVLNEASYFLWVYQHVIPQIKPHAAII